MESKREDETMESETNFSNTEAPMSKTTTISTIAVQSGKTRIVIALLHCGDWIQLKILEITPELTTLGNTLSEALELQKAHDEVLRQLQNKQSPVEELLRQADQLISTQKPRAEVYAAMAESLGRAWKDVNFHLELRKHILDLNVQYHTRAQEFFDKIAVLEASCADTLVPIEIDAVKNFLTNIDDQRKAVLEALIRALHSGNALIAKLKELGAKGTLDSRPDRIRTSVEKAIAQVQGWMNDLHVPRTVLETTFTRRKKQLEQCLALAVLAADMRELEETVCERRELLVNTDQLGDSSSSAEILQFEHKKLLPEAKQLQEKALKITKATEKLLESGCFAGEEATKQAYTVLSTTSDYLTDLQQRDALLDRVIAFFRLAQTALTKLDQLEDQLTKSDLPKTSPQLAQLHAQCAKTIESITEEALAEGHAILELVGRGKTGTEGVKRMVEELENRKIRLNGLCVAHKEENRRINEVLNKFLEKQSTICSWLVDIAEEFLHSHTDMGRDLPTAKDFLNLHNQLLIDLQTKGNEINVLLLTLPPILEYLDDDQRQEVDRLVANLHDRWRNIKDILEKRLDLANIYVKFHEEAKIVNNEMDRLEETLERSSGNLSDESVQRIETDWESLKPLYESAKNTGLTFKQISKVSEPYLDTKRACVCVDSVLEALKNRQLVVTRSWQTFQTEIEEKRELLIKWEENMVESTKTISWVTKLDSQLYPVITTNATSPKDISEHVQKKLETVLPEIKRAQCEVEQRIRTTEALMAKSPPINETSLAVKNKLSEMNYKLVEITREYQTLLEKLVTYFNHLHDVDKTMNNINNKFSKSLPRNLIELDVVIREHETSTENLIEAFKSLQNECSQLVDRINRQEPQSAAEQDIAKLQHSVRFRRDNWERDWNRRRDDLEAHRQLCQFDSDLQQINNTLNDLSNQLAGVKGQYGESLPAANAISLNFVYFEKTIEELEKRIETFVRKGEQMLEEQHVHSPHINHHVRDLQDRWNKFKQQVRETRRLIDLSIKYFQLVEEADKWFREGSRLLMSITKKATTVKKPEEAQVLLNEIETFLKPGESKQDERIRHICQLSAELFGHEKSPQYNDVVIQNTDMLESFSEIRRELEELSKNLKLVEEQREKARREQEEADAKLEAAKAEAAAAKAAAQAAEEARRAAEIAAKVMKESTISHNVEIIELPYVREIPVVDEKPVEKTIEIVEIEQQPKMEPPKFTSPLNDAVIEEGSKFTFVCRVTGVPMPIVTWYKDGISIQNFPDYETSFDQGLCTLTIEETFADDSARYTCKATNAAGSAESNAALLVKETEPEEQLLPPTFVKYLQPTSIKEGQPFQFECKVEGNPLPTVQWYKNADCIDNSPDYIITYNNGEAILKFDKVYLVDKAEYCCKATNDLGIAQCSATLNVIPMEPTESPAFTVPLSNVMARAGQKIKLECEVSGLPPPTLTWSHNGKTVRETREIKLLRDGKKGTLLVNEAFPKDAGTYIVTASNIAGEATSGCTVSVKGRLPIETSDSELASDMEPIKPAIQLPLQNVTIVEGKEARLDCVIVGQPEPEVIWYHDDLPVKESPEFQLKFQGDHCTLIIPIVVPEDAGEYKVIARNSAGEASSKCVLTINPAAETKVDAKPEKLAGVPPKFDKLLSDVLISEGDRVILEAAVTGEPTPEVKWLLNNQVIQANDRVQLTHDDEGNLKLEIEKVLPEDKGVYTVKASNPSGDAKCFAQLIVKSSKPTEVKVHEEAKSAPAFKESFTDRTVFQNTSTKFECIVTGRPTPKVRWYFNDEPVSGKNFLVSTSGDWQVLSIPDATQENAGRIKCVAENDVGRATLSANLTVKEVNDIVLQDGQFDMTPYSRDIQQHTESSYTLKREVFTQSSTSQSSKIVSSAGSTEPHIEERKIISQREQTFKQEDQKPPQIQAAQKFEEYHHVGKQPVAYEKSSTFVSSGGIQESKTQQTQQIQQTVIHKPVIKARPPKFITPVIGKIVDQGADVILEGILDGFPAPEVKWTKNGVPITSGEDIKITFDLNCARVEIKNVNTNDGGQYTCTAVNEAGKAVCTSDLVVKKTIFPPVFGHRLQAQVIKKGDRVIMNVEVTGTPEPTVTWHKDGIPIEQALKSGYKVSSQGNSHTLIIEKADLSHTGKYMVRAVNSGGEAQSIADMAVFEPTPDTMVEVVKTVVFEDVRKHETLELISTPIITSISTTEKIIDHGTKQETLEPFPYQPEPIRPKRTRAPPPPSPSKFVKGEFRESDYESEYEGRIPPVWRPSSTEPDPAYRPVRPDLTPTGRISQTSERIPTPPSQFDVPPQVGTMRPKFEPIEKPKKVVKMEEIVKPIAKPALYKPLPTTPKHEITDVIVATPAAPEKVLQPGTPPEIGYAPGPQKTQYYKSTTSAPYQNAVQTETSNVMHFNEATEHSRRTVSLQQTTKVIKFGDQSKETFQYKTDTDRQRYKGPPPPKPSKFIPGEFRESDYESEVESARIKPKWAPTGSDTEDFHYRKVRPPSITRASSVPTYQERISTPMEFDIRPPEISSKISTESHVSEISKRFGETKSSQTIKSSDFALQPGSPPEYGYVPEKITKSTATKIASKHMDSMTQSFKSKAQKFVNDIVGDVNKKTTQKPILKAKDDTDAQVYREETRAAQYGTKHVDPDTGLIYFKYDFGYEFGIVLPGESKSGEIPVPKKTVIEPPKRSTDIEMPVYHESSTKPTTNNTHQFRPKKFTSTNKNVKWEPTSESEMSEYEGESKKKVPGTGTRWEQSSCSPVSISPSLPSTSPAFNNYSAHLKGTETPPSCPSTPGSIPAQQGLGKRAPLFITPLRDIAVVIGQTARFECIVQSEPPPSILWSKNGRIIENCMDHQIFYRNGVCRLTIPKAFPEDAGTYTCTATNQVGAVGTTATLQVPGVPSHMYGTYRQMSIGSRNASPDFIRYERPTSPPVFTHHVVQGGQYQAAGAQQVTGFGPNAAPPVFEKVFSNARFAQGGNALFEGRVTGKPMPQVSWTRKGTTLIQSSKYNFSYNNQNGDITLQINQIGPGDEGEYVCTARNQYGEAICSVYISPEGMPMPPMQGFQKSKTVKQTTVTNGTFVEEFKVDTFEYRLLREVSFRESITRRFVGEQDIQMSTTVERSLGPPAPPQISQKPRNSKLLEGSDAVFAAKVGANPRPRLTWFKNGQRITESYKYETSYSNNQATLRVKQAQHEDSGHYTLLAENPQGCVVSSAYLAIEPVNTQEGLIHESQFKSQQIEEEDDGKTLAPNFVRVCGDRDVTEGKMTRFDCRVTGRPYPEVTWFINGRQVTNDSNHKILVNESGNHSLMITNVSRNDSGVVTCIARNKTGETSFQCNLNVIEKEQVVAPKFVERFTTLNVKEGEPVVLNARAVGTPTPRITWQKDGVPISSGPDVRISTDSGASTLDIPRAKASDAAWYQCTAQNVAGSTATRARLFVETPQGPTPEPRRLHLPRPTKVIEPEPVPGPEVIYLRHVEPSRPHVPSSEEDRIYVPPQFIIPLHDIQQIEGGKAHFEARIEPVGDPTMVVEWFLNGKQLAASSRATSIFKFGFIALDLISLNIQDSGEYVCRVTSSTGSVVSRALLTVTARASIEKSSQHPESLQYIQHLEDYSRYERQESIEEKTKQKPHFIRPLQDLGELQEGRNAHFEAQLNPVSDPTMKVEWYKDGRPITASSRITTIFNFGYVSLNIMHLRAEDAGTYTVRAVNHLGEAISSASISVFIKSTVTGDLGIPEQQRYIEKVEELEAYQQAQLQKYVQEAPESNEPPDFKTPIKDQVGIREGGFAHFEARLTPVGDSTLKVEWLKDGKAVEASSRITTFFNFGYVALTIKDVTIHDVGNYICRAYNALGQATTTAQLSVISKKDIIVDSQHPGGLEKIQFLEDTTRLNRIERDETQVTQKPKFLGPLKGTNRIIEGQRAHFEARVEPQSDLTMKTEWYCNGKPIQTANRIQTYHDFGYVALDILSVRAEDAGNYTVVARNALGEAQLSSTMIVETRSSIDTRSVNRTAYDKTRALEDSKFIEPQYEIEEISKSKPIFTQPLSDPRPVTEGRNIHLECRLEPMGDPTMRVEWFCNGRPVTVGSRFRTYNDFGFVALDIIHATASDTGEYTARATNHLGSAATSAQVRVIAKSDIITDSQHELSLEQLQMLEGRQKHQPVEDVTIFEAPHFTRPLHNIETVEGTNIHMECRLQPVGDSSMRVEWFCNGRPVKVGHRFRPAYDFDYVALDLLSVYPVDSGVYTCQARNQLGEAVTSCSVKVIAKKDLYFDTQHPGGLEKIQQLEDHSRAFKRTEYIEEVVNVKPRFITKPKSLENMREGEHAHFECKVEPITDSNLKVEWFKNGRPITVGHRFRPIHDFGYVALDIIDLIAEDSGTYTCRAVNLVGSDETTCTLKCVSTSQIITQTQNEQGLEQIQHLEDRSKYQRQEDIEETTKQIPIFTTSLKNVEIKEGQRAHFECRLIPVSDATMKVEWFHNGKPLKSGSRFSETNNFGFVALDILYAYPEDSGTYTCRATNALGEAVTSAQCNVLTKKSIVRESVHEGALERLQELEDSSRYQRKVVQEEIVTQAPCFTVPVKDLRVAENQAAHFEARLIPVGDSRMKVEWLRNGVPIEASNRLTTMHDFGYVALNMKYVNPEDSGTYTCRAVNEIGEAVTSATLFVQSKASLQLETQHEGALQKLRQLEDTSKYQRREAEEVQVTQAPRFTTHLNGPTELYEGQSAHYECRIEPYPDSNLKVEWYHNGKPLSTGHRFRTAYDFGFASLDVLTVYAEDSGTYTCKATNLIGQAESSVVTNIKSKSGIIRDTQHEGALQKIQYLEDDSRYKRVSKEDVAILEKPQFGRGLKPVENLPEGKTIHLEATLTPVNDPTMRVEWFCNGRPLPSGSRYKTTYDFGFVALDILHAYPEDNGTYMCRARNAVGEAVTTAAVSVVGRSGLQLETLDEQRLRKIKDLEAYERPKKEEIEPQMQKPVFLTPLINLENLKEGEHAHLECRVEPINDANLRIEWFVNGVKLKTGHRFRTTHDFGYVALDVLYAYPEDSGTYMCKATNLVGEAVNTCTVNVGTRRSIILDTQHPEGLEKIRELEAQGHPARLEVEEPAPFPPRFVTELRGTTELYEGQTAHFEAQIEPIHDPNLRIEFYHNGKPLQSASRFHITFDFGYVALDISHVVPEDAGEYSVKAINNLGQCVSSIKMRVIAKSNIILDSQRPEGLDKIRQLEEHQQYKRPEVEEPVTRQRPVFTQPLQNIDNIIEGQTAHFECRLIPVGDPTLKVEWFRNEKPLEDSSRITKVHDFGYVSLDISHVRDEDQGVYMCRASNPLGEAVTTASMRIRTKASIQLETQHAESMRKIQQLEQPLAPRAEEPERIFEKPIFTQVLTGPTELWEGQHAHFEARVVPVGDPSLKFQWFVNGVELKLGSRIRVTNDFGFVTLDVLNTVTNDSGVYMCKAFNKSGEAVSSISMKVKARSSIADEALHPDAWEKIQQKEAEMNRVPEMFVDTTPQQPPVFTTHLKNYDNLVEGQHVYLEAQVEPRADPNLKVEWFKNGISLTTGTRLRSTFDFGLVTLSINSLRDDDTAIYTCKATNLYGEAISTCTLKIKDKHWLLGDTLHPDAIPKLAALDAPRAEEPARPEPTYEAPIFISHLNNVENAEGDSAHFECNVEPSKDPTMKIEWFINGKPLPTGARFKSTYDFGYVALDINHCYAEDSGIYTCKATNSKGSATTTGTLRTTDKAKIYWDTQHPQGKAGLEAVEEVDSAYANKQLRQPSGPEKEYPKPVWTTPLNPEFIVSEGKPLHLEGTVEPKEDPNLKIEWFFNGKSLEHASRFKLTSDFGFVTLDLTDVYDRDQGIYTAKASNKAGEAFTSTTIYCTTKAGLIERTQHPKGQEGLEKIQDLEDALNRIEQPPLESDEGHAPVFTSEFTSLSNLGEGEIAHFEAGLTPIGDQTMKVEWFYNGKAIEASHRFRTVHAFGMVVLEILGTKTEDSGTYTCVATNAWGKAEQSVTLECVEKIKRQPPKFTTQLKDIVGLKDGQPAHFECTLVPVNDPKLKVEWFHDGRPILQSTRIKTVSDFGFVVMDIAYTQNHDSGEYVCKASNEYGEDYTKATINAYGRSGVFTESLQPDSLAKIRELESYQVQQTQVQAAPITEPPKFITQIADITKLIEGQSAHFEARLTPVNDPDLVVEWYYNGKKLPHGHRFRTFHDFGIVILDILYCYEENSGVYECRAYNKFGEDSTKATLKCTSKTNLILTSQLPRGMEGGLEKIQTLEDSLIRIKEEKETEERGKAPVFTEPLSNIDNLREGESAHFEARLTPTDDPKLKVEWYWNGKPLKTGSRFRTFCDFGFVILEISPVYPEDSGEYSCRAFNDYGEAVTTSSMKIQGKRSIILESQLPQGMEGTIDKIAELEGLGVIQAQVAPEEDTGRPPEFITTPSDLQLSENSLAHFECKLQPVNDQSMRVEWFHNGKPLWAGSRIKTINDFGFVILEVANVYQRDSGLYTCKATNKHGEATVSCKLQVRGRQGIIMEPQLPANFRTGTASIQKLEEDLYKREEITTEEEVPNPPKFTVDIKDNVDVPEGGPLHFDCRVEPINDPTMRIEWFHNGRPFATGSRVHQLNDFGFIALDIDYSYGRDAGEYICRATNKWGTATTKATVTTTSKRNIDFDSQLPSGMSAEKLKELEKGKVSEAPKEEEPAGPPKFITQIESATVEESESVFFECRVEPKHDSNLRIEWYRNGKLLPCGSRYKTTYEMGYVSLGITYVYPEDSGEYVCRAVNNFGEDFTRASVSCKTIPSIILQNQVPKGMKRSETLMQMEAAIKKYTSEIHLTEEDLYDAEKKQPPRFVTQIQDQTELVEMQSTKFECQLAPVGDPNMKVEWFLNGKPLPHKNRFTPIYDFGYVAMNFGWVYPEDSGEYVCRATNLYGMDETRAIIKTAGKPGIIYESQLPKGMKSIERIREMEAAWQVAPDEPDEDTKPRSAPLFVSKPEPCTVEEGEWARFCCRVTGHPRPRVMWLINGHTVVNGSRYRLTYDGMYHLDIPKTRQYDTGKVEVIARSSVGEAIAETELKVIPRHDDYRGVLKNSPRPWYDIELQQYQRERQDTELERYFDERHQYQQTSAHPALHILQRLRKEPAEAEWQQAVKTKKNEEYYNKLQELENEQVTRELKHREQSHQFAVPGEKIVASTIAKGMAQKYEDKLEHQEETTKKEMYSQQQLKKTGLRDIKQHSTEIEIDSKKGGYPPEPAASAVHGREVYVTKQKQTQKETIGDTEITRKITATETTDVEHKAMAEERLVQGQVLPTKPPFFTKKIQPVRAFENDSARFEVEFDGDPLPTIKWFREDFPITSSPDLKIYTFSTKSILQMRQVFMEDSGVFTVIAENRGGSAKCSANLVVQERRRSGRTGPIPPSFVTTVQNTTANAGQLVRFDARINGTKPIDVYWLKDGKKISPSDIRYKSLEEDEVYTLLIIEVVPDDSGKYECVAMNKAGEARCEAECVVTAPASPTKPSKPTTPGAEKPPTVVEPLKNQTVREGQVVTFKCKITGKPTPTIKWQRGDKVIKPSKYFQMLQEGENYTLKITEAFPEDEGVYKCVAANPAGTNETQGTLKVTAAEVQETLPTLTKMKDVIVPEGSPAQFKTTVTGKPRPTIQWLREGFLIPESPDFQMIHEGNNAVLLISTTYEEDSGVFTCRATSSAGQVEQSAKLIVKSKK